MDLNGILLGVFLLALAMAIVLYLPARLTRRAMHQVIRRFYEKEALDPDGARTLDELGLTPPNFLEKLSKPRDYKPTALRLLQQMEAVQMTQEGKLFLVEEKLHPSLRIPRLP
jgi:hypothetical protein